MSLLDLTVQATISLVVLVDPIFRAIFFRVLTENEPENRAKYVRRLMIVIAVILLGSALVGKFLLDLIGINLGAFGIIGGLVLVLMGFEMLFAGRPSRAQGGAAAAEAHPVESAADQIIVPYAIPFMAGPGAITTVITISTAGEGFQGTIAAVIASVIVVALIPVGHLVLVNRIRFSEQGLSLAQKFGGLFVATIGAQLMLSGVQTFYGF
ncbi:MarC family protein [Agromyces sp. SYSU T00194]|uniref:MarC family protein n=1 Tax=Agromyces chitinivorans TaxID=3158560 RepID=UPI0033963C11